MIAAEETSASMKKRTTLLALVLLVTCNLMVFGSDWRYVFWDLDQHPEILAGFVPTYISMGTGYDGLHLIEGRTTEIQMLAGGGYVQRKLWQNPLTGEQITDDPLVFDVMRFDWRLKFSQGFLASPVPGKDLLTFFLGYDGGYNQTVDSMVVGQQRKNNSTRAIKTIDEWFSGHGSSQSDNHYYPDMGKILFTVLFTGVKFDMMDDKGTTQDGVSSELKASWSPSALNNTLKEGTADYYSLTSNTVLGKTLYVLTNAKGRNTFSIALVDRVNLNWTDGNAVPAFAQGPVSLGRKVRGFNTWSYNTQFTVVNNFDVRFCGPEPIIKGIFPRVNLFFDAGYGCGKYFNSTFTGSNFLSSVGVQATLCFFDFIDLGIQYAYLFTGQNFVHYGDSLVFGATFFLDF